MYVTVLHQPTQQQLGRLAEHLYLFDAIGIEAVHGPSVFRQLHAANVLEATLETGALKLVQVGPSPVTLPTRLLPKSVLAVKSYGPMSVAVVDQDQSHFAKVEQVAKKLGLPQRLLYWFLDNPLPLDGPTPSEYINAVDHDLFSDSIFAAAGATVSFEQLLDETIKAEESLGQPVPDVNDWDRSPEILRVWTAQLGETHQRLFLPMTRVAMVNRMMAEAKQGFSVSGGARDQALVLAKFAGSVPTANSTRKIADFEELLTANKLPDIPTLIDSGRLTMASVLKMREKHAEFRRWVHQHSGDPLMDTIEQEWIAMLTREQGEIPWHKAYIAPLLRLLGKVTGSSTSPFSSPCLRRGRNSFYPGSPTSSLLTSRLISPFRNNLKDGASCRGSVLDY